MVQTGNIVYKTNRAHGLRGYLIGKEDLPMPWKETCTMKERELFINAWLERVTSITQLCKRFGISRNTGYKWIERFIAE